MAKKIEKIPEKYQTSDGQVFEDQAKASRHQELIDLKNELEIVQERLKLVLGKNFQTADGYPFELHAFGEYYVVHNSYYGMSSISRVDFWVRDIEIDDDGTIYVFESRGDHSVMVRYRMSQIYKREKYAQLALLDAMERSLARFDEEVTEFRASLEKKYGPIYSVDPSRS